MTHTITQITIPKGTKLILMVGQGIRDIADQDMSAEILEGPANGFVKVEAENGGIYMAPAHLARPKPKSKIPQAARDSYAKWQALRRTIEDNYAWGSINKDSRDRAMHKAYMDHRARMQAIEKAHAPEPAAAPAPEPTPEHAAAPAPVAEVAAYSAPEPTAAPEPTPEIPIAAQGVLIDSAPCWEVDGVPGVWVRSRTNTRKAYNVNKGGCNCPAWKGCWHMKAATLAPVWEASARELYHVQPAHLAPLQRARIVALTWDAVLASQPRIRGKADVIGAIKRFATEAPAVAVAPTHAAGV